MPREFTAIEPVPILFAYFEYKSKFDFESECFDDCIVIFICVGANSSIRSASSIRASPRSETV